jgi:hypothetical protein
MPKDLTIPGRIVFQLVAVISSQQFLAQYLNLFQDSGGKISW